MDPQTNQSNSDNQTTGYYSTGPASSGGSGTDKRKFVGWGIFGFLILAIVGGILYGANELIGVANTEREKLAAAQAANEALPEEKRVYFGDGSDISEIAEAKEITACPDGYTEKGDKCEKTETKTADPAVYRCPSDYKKQGSGNNTTCVKIVGGKVESQPASRAVVCESGWTQSGNSCTKKETVDVELSYSCASGYQVSGVGAATKCTRTSTESGTVRASCTGGYSVSGSGRNATCRLQTDATSSTSNPTCPSGGSRISNTTCRLSMAIQQKPNYACPSTVTGSYNIAGTAKVVFLGSSQGGSYKCQFKKNNTYGCFRQWKRADGGTSMGAVPGASSYTSTTCIVNAVISSYTAGCASTSYRLYAGACIYDYAATPGVTTWSCPDGVTPDGSRKCNYSKAANLYCDSGFAKSGSGSGTSCSRVNIQNASAIVSKSCGAGYTQAGDKCERTNSKAGESKYSCSGDYDLSGTNCIKIIGGSEVKANPSVSYSCPSGYKSSGSGSDTKCTKEEKSTADKQKQYVCEDGWTKRQEGEKIDCVLVKS